MNLDSSVSQLKKGQLTYALNAVVENFDGQQVGYQNEPANAFCCTFPEGYKVIGTRNILEVNKTIFFLVNPVTSSSEIGFMDNDSCLYVTYFNSECLNFSIHHPIHKIVPKITNCSVEVYWTDGLNPRRFIDLQIKPLREVPVEGECELELTSEIDCNKIKVQPDYQIPELLVKSVESDGDLQAGTYQFGIQYSNAIGEAYTSLHSITNPTPIFDSNKLTLDFNYTVARSIQVQINNLDRTGFFDYFNLVVVKTVNDIATPYLVGTYEVTAGSQTIMYTGQNKEEIRLTMADVFEKFPIYDTADDLTTVQDVLVWKGLTTNERLNYQSIASKINLLWETHRIPGLVGYGKEEYATHLRGYMRDEVYAFEICFLLKNGHQTDGFHIPGRAATTFDLEEIESLDILGEDEICETEPGRMPRWKIYNTGTRIGYSKNFCEEGQTEDCVTIDECYVGPYEYGNFAYWESAETYPCNEEVWGELAGKPIRHHKFPDSLITHIHDTSAIYPIGVRVDAAMIHQLIRDSNLTDAQKAEIVGFKVLRSNRANQKSIVARGLINNVGVYERQGNDYFYPNYPYNDLRPDPFIAKEYTYDDSGKNESKRLQGFSTSASKSRFTFHSPDTHFFQPFLGNILKLETAEYGYSRGHFVQVQDHAKYKFPSSASFAVAVAVGILVTLIPIQAGVIIGIAGPTAGIAGFQLTQDIIFRAIPRKNFAYQYNSIGNYFQYKPVPNAGIKQRRLTVAAYAQPGMLSVGDIHPLNNFQRESSVYLATKGNLPFPHHIQDVPEDKSRYTITEVNNSRITEIDPGSGGTPPGPCPGAASIGISELAAPAGQKYFLVSIGPNVVAGYTYSVTHSSGAYITYTANSTDTAATVAAALAAQIWGSSVVSSSYTVGTTFTVRSTDSGNVLVDASGDCAATSGTYSSGYINPDEAANCDNPNVVTTTNISSFYATIKRNLVNQYGQIYSYETIDTGTQFLFGVSSALLGRYISVFGGDTFINRFGLKTKMPFFIDHRVKVQDDSDVFYDELGNVAYPIYWFSTDVKEAGTDGGGGGKGIFKKLKSAMGIKVNNFDCRKDKFFYQDGKIYLFAYGIPYFFCESEVNVDMRQAYNSAEGDFYPHVGGDIPDWWLQETNVSIQKDNTYHYNRTYSKQNKENNFSHLGIDYTNETCRYTFPFLAIYSEQQKDVTNYRRNNWLIYRPAAKFNFPQNNGRLISLDGLENKAVLARFENKSLLYNTMLRIDTSNPLAAYLGNDTLFKSSPPIDFADAHLGYAGSQHKMFIKTEKGHLSVDALRGKVFLYGGTNVQEISNIGLLSFFMQHLPFKMAKAFPGYNCDNHFNGVGIHGTVDAVYNRIIITKLDYEPIVTGVTYEDGVFYINSEESKTAITLGDPQYFANRSFTLSFDFDNKAWISFHTYHPNFYIAFPHYFQSGYNSEESSLWTHMKVVNKYNNFSGQIAPYVLEYPFSYPYHDEILQNIKDYTKVYEVDEDLTYIVIDNVFFNKAILSNDQQTSGLLELEPKPKNSMQAQLSFPKYNLDSKSIIYTKSDNFYNYNTFWGLVKNKGQKLFIRNTALPLSYDKELNQSNMDYSKRSFKKEPLRAKDLKVRHILDNTSDYKFLSQFIVAPTLISVK
jgi:hypothetical protein